MGSMYQSRNLEKSVGLSDFLRSFFSRLGSLGRLNFFFSLGGFGEIRLPYSSYWGSPS